MEKREIQRFKMLLEVRQHDLRLSIEHNVQSTRTAEPEPDTLDQATSQYEKQSSLQRSNREQGLLHMVEAALDRIQCESFGQCLSCGKGIDQKRLQAVPWTRYCIHCQRAVKRVWHG